MKLLLDHHYATAIAELLRARGHDVQAALERGWQAEDDETLLELCAAEQRVLLTNNVADFAVISRRWAATNRQHAGLIFTSDRSLPRSQNTIGRFAACLDELLRQDDADTALAGQVRWLPSATGADQSQLAGSSRSAGSDADGRPEEGRGQ